MPCCAVVRWFSQFALIAAMTVFAVVESVFGVRGRPGRVAGFLDGELVLQRRIEQNWAWVYFSSYGARLV